MGGMWGPGAKATTGGLNLQSNVHRIESLQYVSECFLVHQKLQKHEFCFFQNNNDTYPRVVELQYDKTTCLSKTAKQQCHHLPQMTQLVAA